MFDDPRKELRRMEAELMAAEEGEQPELDLDAILCDTEDDAWLQEAKALIGEESAPQNEKRRSVRNGAPDFHRMAYADEAMNETTAYFVEKKSRKLLAKQEKQSLGCLPLVAALEIIGILILSWWWYRWLR